MRTFQTHEFFQKYSFTEDDSIEMNCKLLFNKKNINKSDRISCVSILNLRVCVLSAGVSG